MKADGCVKKKNILSDFLLKNTKKTAWTRGKYMTHSDGFVAARRKPQWALPKAIPVVSGDTSCRTRRCLSV